MKKMIYVCCIALLLVVACKPAEKVTNQSAITHAVPNISRFELEETTNQSTSSHVVLYNKESSCTKSANSIKTTLKGEVIDRPQSSQLLLIKRGESPTVNEEVYIPINDGKFEYVLNCEHEEQYDLVFEEEYVHGYMIPVSFFSEQGVINFTLYPANRFNENKIEGGKLTREYWDYFTPILNEYEAIEKEFHAKSKQYLEDNYDAVFDKQELLDDDFRAKVEQLEKEGVNIEPIIKARSELNQLLYQDIDQKRILSTLQYIKEHTNIVGYSLLFSETNSMIDRNRIFQETNDITPYANLYMTVFAPKYPDHPYTEQMEILLAGSLIKAGVPFVDFTTDDLTGKPVKLSERIAGKPTVLHLWASWCGPCRKKGKELIPVYEEFRDKGFVVIGVAREKSVSSAETAIKKDKYPWENLIELNEAGKIWAKYGIGNAGGMVFLIDENGIIVANDPSVEEIRDFLLNKL